MVFRWTIDDKQSLTFPQRGSTSSTRAQPSSSSRGGGLRHGGRGFLAGWAGRRRSCALLTYAFCSALPQGPRGPGG